MKKIFLLGGYDLEMVEIRSLLEEKKVTCFDKKLNWENAFLNQYADILAIYGDSKDTYIYGIELRENDVIHIPDNYYRIDHHNDFNDRPSSLQQVADTLNIELSHYQKLVAANDTGYIPAMMAMGATLEEISEIRQKDRFVQGVTENDELLAEDAIESKTIENGIIIVKSETSRFSPICDRLYPYDKLLVFTDNELMHYGEEKKRLVEEFEEEIHEGKMFHGGTENGYLGTVKGAYSKVEIIQLKNKIINL